MIPIVQSMPDVYSHVAEVTKWYDQRGFVSDERLTKIYSWGEGETRYGKRIAEFAERLGQSFIMVEADIAIDLFDVRAWYKFIAEHPDDVSVGIYHLHPGTSGLPHSVIAHRWRSGATKQLHWIPDDWRWGTVDSIGFGCVYFPYWILRRAIDDGVFHKPENSPHIDTAFSEWCEARGVPMRICWNVRAKHLNFSWPSVLDQNT